LGILKYYELELRISTFDEAINILKELPMETNEERLFKIIEDINVDFINSSLIFLIFLKYF